MKYTDETQKLIDEHKAAEERHANKSETHFSTVRRWQAIPARDLTADDRKAASKAQELAASLDSEQIKLDEQYIQLAESRMLPEAALHRSQAYEASEQVRPKIRALLIRAGYRDPEHPEISPDGTPILRGQFTNDFVLRHELFLAAQDACQNADAIVDQLNSQIRFRKGRIAEAEARLEAAKRKLLPC